MVIWILNTNFKSPLKPFVIWNKTVFYQSFADKWVWRLSEFSEQPIECVPSPSPWTPNSDAESTLITIIVTRRRHVIPQLLILFQMQFHIILRFSSSKIWRIQYKDKVMRRCKPTNLFYIRSMQNSHFYLHLYKMQ